ncbi:MAG: fibronectin type III domain-containing protein, partial [Nonlabens sp.]|uniref:fibronectin type III domain-containing protein n=1 Tax=Nonlabens sp. TaxID=1888209 RepID=UPI0035A6DAE9
MKLQLLLSTLVIVAVGIFSSAQSTINITTTGGSFATEKWVSITDMADGAGTQIWGQGDGTYGNAQGLINQDIMLAPGTYWVNCYDRYADGWDGTTIDVTAYGASIGNNGGVSPDDGTNNDAGSGWETPADELEASFMIVVPSPPSCTVPTAIVSSNITAASADFSWTASASEVGGYNWEVVPQGDAQGVNVVSSGTTASGALTVTASGLSSTTPYDFYISTDCGATGMSIWAGPITFTTACATIVPDALETFDTFVPDCWEEAADGDLTTGPTGFGSGDWRAEEFAHSSTSGGGAVNINLYRNVASDWIVSPLYDLSAGGYELNIDVAVTDFNSTGAYNMGSDDLVVLAYTTDGTTWTALQTWDVNNQPATAGETYNDALTGINSATVRFGIYATDGTIVDAGVDYDFHIDNFQIRTPPTCPDTSNLTLVTNTDVTATINFDSGNAMSAGNYEYSLTTVAGATPVVSGAWSDVAGATPNVTYTITGLTAATEYFVHVREVCAVGDESVWSGPLAFTTECETIIPDSIETFTTFVPD